MKKTLDVLEGRIKNLEVALKNAKKEAQLFPAGRIRLSCSRGKRRYYLVLPGQSSNGTYISIRNKALIGSLAQKEYNTRFLRLAERELASLRIAAKKLKVSDADSVYEGMHQGLKPFVKPYLDADEMYARSWQAKEFRECSYRPEAKIFRTEKGEKVRSKSEALIASILLSLGIPYHYEKPLYLGDGKTRYPDFTLLNVKERKEYYLEHFGKMDDSQYVKGCQEKIYEYGKNGIYLGVNLLATFESYEKPLDIEATREMLRVAMLE